MSTFLDESVPVITIDGTSSVGKGTVSKLLAEKLGWHILDSGAIYRALALHVIRKKIPQNNIPFLVEASQKLDIQFIQQSVSNQKIFLFGEDVTSAIRQEECGNVASRTSGFLEVRAALISKQHSFCQPPGLVADGRDMGTVVFPKAKFKFFLTASAKERARRHLLYLQAQGINDTLDTVLNGLTERDERDIKRVVSPLKPDPAAVIIDTTKLSVNEVVQQILAHVNNVYF